MRRTRHLQRGQALAEFAVSSMLFVLVLLSGLYFSEIGWLGLKAHEAANFATFDMTRRSAVEIGATSVVNTPAVISASQAYSQARYNDLDVNSATGGTGVNTGLSGTSTINVDCLASWGNNPGPDYFLPPGSIPTPTTSFQQDVAYLQNLNDHRNLAVTAGNGYAELIGAMRDMFPRGFAGWSDLTGGACRTTMNIGTVPFLSFLGNINICSPGRAEGGVCTGHFPVLLGDYGLDRTATSPDGSGDCIFGNCANVSYRTMIAKAHRTHLDNDTSIDKNFLDISIPTPVGWVQIFDPYGLSVADSANQWVMSFSGREHNYVDGATGATKFNTAGVFAGGSTNTPSEEGAFGSAYTAPGVGGSGYRGDIMANPGRWPRRNPGGWWLGQNPHSWRYQKYNY